MQTEHGEEQLLAFTQAMANMVAADGRITAEERDELENVVAGIGLSPRDEKVMKLIDAEFANPGDLSQIVKRIEAKDLKAALVRMLVEMACTDGDLAAEERAKVGQAASAFGFAPTLVDELVAWTLESVKLDRREQDLMAKLMA